MARIFSVVLFLFVLFVGEKALAQSSTLGDSLAKPRLRISILTCTPGLEEWETFGHACIRVIDSSRTDAERDKIYNYGFFEASEDNTLWHQALTGRVVDLLDTITFDELMYEYNIKQRGIFEQELLLTDLEKQQVLAYLKNNLKRESRYYEFDTFYDNCTTRITDLLNKLFGNRLNLGQVLLPGSRTTFRDVTVTTLCPQQQKYWFGFAVNLTYASPTDRVMTNDQAMFLPSILSMGLIDATLGGKKLCGEKIVIRPDNVRWENKMNQPFWLILFISTIVVACLLFANNFWGKTAGNTLVFLTGVLGILLVYLWQLDGEPAWKNNFNILWALPLNVVFPFLAGSIRKWYSVVAIACLFSALVVHFLRVQVMPLIEIWPLLAALLFCFGFSVSKRFNR